MHIIKIIIPCTIYLASLFRITMSRNIPVKVFLSTDHDFYVVFILFIFVLFIYYNYLVLLIQSYRYFEYVFGILVDTTPFSVVALTLICICDRLVIMFFYVFGGLGESRCYWHLSDLRIVFMFVLFSSCV